MWIMTLGDKIIQELKIAAEKSGKKDFGEADTIFLQVFMTLQTEKASELNPDYRSVAYTEQAASLRWRGVHESVTMLVLAEAMRLHSQASYFGEARALEEMGLIGRYSSNDEPSKLRGSLASLDRAIEGYKKALTNDGSVLQPEIADKKTIQDRLWRTYGVASVNHSILAGTDETNRTKHLEKAVEYARYELNQRIEQGETSGDPLANAYHTVGEAHIELVKEKPETYDEGRAALEKARDIHSSPMVRTVIELKMALLEINTHPENKEGVGELVSGIIAAQTDTSSAWTPALKDRLKSRMERIANHIGEPYVTQLNRFYST